MFKTGLASRQLFQVVAKTITKGAVVDGGEKFLA